MIHQISCEHTMGTAFEVTHDGHSYTLDSAEGNTGPRPKALMLSALAGCTGFDLVSLLEKMRVVYSQFKITVDAPLTEEHPKIYESFTLKYFIHLENDQDRKQVEKAVQLSVDKYCGVHAMLSKIGPVHHEIIYT